MCFDVVMHDVRARFEFLRLTTFSVDALDHAQKRNRRGTSLNKTILKTRQLSLLREGE